MTIVVGTTNIQASAPVEFALTDKSGAHVILTVSVEGQPPITHGFDFAEGTLVVPLDLKRRSYRCTFVIQAFKHGALSGMFASALTVNGQLAASASGNIPAGRQNDVGFGDFTLVVA
jgi:hypothetical protein